MPWIFLFKQGTFSNGSGPGILLIFGQVKNPIFTIFSFQE